LTPTKLLIGQILVVFAIVIAGVWSATQWAAMSLAYQPDGCAGDKAGHRNAGAVLSVAE
jgi:hypothetical protein